MTIANEDDAAGTGQFISWDRVAPGVWRRRCGTPEALTLLSAAGGTPQIDALTALPETDFPIDLSEIRIAPRKGKIALRFPLGEDEDIYGLGLDFHRLRKNKTVQRLKIDAWGGQSGRTHAPVPLLISSRGYGILVNSARYLDVYVGTGVRTDTAHPPTVYDRNTDRTTWESAPRSDSIEVLVPADGVEVLVFAGPTPLDAVRRYNLFCGGGCLPPKWGLGFTLRTPTLYTQEQVLDEAREFERRGFPLDFIGLEPGWHDHAYPCSFEWDRTRFPDPKKLADDLYRTGVRVNLWFNPYVAPKSRLYEKLAPLSGSHTVWNGLVPDYTLPEARAIFADHLRENQVALGPGISGFKIDEVDGHDHWLWPDTATFPSGHEAEPLRQTYGLLVQRLTYDLFREQDRRPYGLARGSNAGASFLPYVLYSDSYSYEGYLTALCSSGFSGILWCPEVRGAKSATEWLRRIQNVCFSPLAMLNAWSSGTKPWTFDAVTEPVRQVMLLRMRLLPYLYTTFAQYRFEGTPPIRPLPLLGGSARRTTDERTVLDDTANPYEEARTRDITDQYLLGDSLLVAPLPLTESERTVVLPRGRWFDFYTGAFAGNNESITIPADRETIPLFVRDGAIIPLIPERRHAPRAGEIVPLLLRHYGDADGDFTLYDDDGETFAYENGACTRTRFRTTRDSRGNRVGECLPDPGATGKPFSYGEITWVFYGAEL